MGTPLMWGYVENANEAFDRVGQVANVMQQADIAEGKAPARRVGRANPAAESLFAGTLDPITQIWTEDY